MKLLLLLFVALIFALFGAIHGLRTKELNLLSSEPTTESQKINRRWHGLQAVLHGVIAVAVAFHNFSIVGFIISFLTTLAIIWVVFDLSHNLSAGQPWWYSENKGINGTIKKFVKTDRMLLLVKAVTLTGLLIIYFIL